MHFVDTNVLIYSLGLTPRSEAKRLRSRAILNEPDCCLSVQVFQEFYTQATRASRPDAVSRSLATALIHDWCRFPVQKMTLDVMNSALETCERYRLSYWDAAIIEAARALGCRTVYSEDMQDGQDFGGVQVIDPFRGLI